MKPLYVVLIDDLDVWLKAISEDLSQGREDAVGLMREIVFRHIQEPSGVPYIRDELVAMALRQERALAKHDKKKGTKGWLAAENTEQLLFKLQEEVAELTLAIVHREHQGPDEDDSRTARPIIKEAVDVANLAMMIVDFEGGLRKASIIVDTKKDEVDA